MKNTNKETVAFLGDALNMLVLAVAVGYQALTFGHFKGWWKLQQFGSHWAADGFCLSFKATYYHTHLLCFYGDTVLAACLWLLCRKETRPELRVAGDSALSVFGHGSAHLFLWYQGDIDVNASGRGGSEHPGGGESQLETALSVLGGSLFFGFFLHALSAGSLWHKLAQSLLHGVALTQFVPLILAFSYVNTVIFVNLTLTQLWHGLDGHKDAFYLLFTVFGSCTVMAAAIVEPLLCDSVLVHWGGHIIFDYTIGLTTAIYYLLGKYYLQPRAIDKAQKVE